MERNTLWICLHEHNRAAWNTEVSKGNPWTVPATEDKIAAAQGGETYKRKAPLSYGHPPISRTEMGREAVSIFAGKSLSFVIFEL